MADGKVFRAILEIRSISTEFDVFLERIRDYHERYTQCQCLCFLCVSRFNQKRIGGRTSRTDTAAVTADTRGDMTTSVASSNFNMASSICFAEINLIAMSLAMLPVAETLRRYMPGE
ncbi:hypothetical protein GWI33_008065 [Rhynchophorus ferrugineus]|uniref:Uncharacterized protein n=1 Tax=Rhynchophorus ferrugineus TaxID=354439 RepID=A0A834MBE8_RHYFE|nr:hypothetical protein GWI33_008065 [Rhynchophorus ferrugineus]